MKKIVHKTISIVVLASLVLSLVQPSIASAQDVIGGPSQVISTLTDIKNTLKEFGLDKIAQVYANQLLDDSTRGVFEWAKTAFWGEPTFVSKPGDFFKNAALDSASLLSEDLQKVAFKNSPEKLDKLYAKAEQMCTAGAVPAGTSTRVPTFDEMKSFVESMGNGVTIQDKDIRDFISTNSIPGGAPNYYAAIDPITADEIATFISGYGITPEYLSINQFLGTLSVATNPGSSSQEGACACKQELSKRIAEQNRISMMNQEQKASFLAQLNATEGIPTIESYIDEKFPIGSCKQIQDSTGQNSFAQQGGYSDQIIKFLGYAYSATDGARTAQTLLPSLTKEASKNWQDFQKDFSKGGWEAYDQAADMRNNPFGAKLLTSSELNTVVQTQVKNYTTQLEQNSGYLNITRCAENKKIILANNKEVCPSGNIETVTPGSLVGEQVATALGGSLKKTSEIKDWGDVLSNALIRLTSGIIDAGLGAANNAIGRQFAGGGSNGSGGGANILARNDIENGNTGDNAMEIVDIDQFLFGDIKIKQKRNAAGALVYEPVLDTATGLPAMGPGNRPLYDLTRPVYEYEPLVDPVTNTSPIGKDGKPIPDLSRPKYEQDYAYKCSNIGGPAAVAAGYCYPNIIPETGERERDMTKPLVDEKGKPVPLRTGGALARTNLMISILESQKEGIRNLPKKMLDLDRCLPGPDMGWDKRLQDKYNSITNGSDGNMASAQKEIGQAVFTIMSDYETGTEQQKNRCQPGSYNRNSMYNLSGNPNEHLDCVLRNGALSQGNFYGMVDAQLLGSTTGVNNIPSAPKIRSLLNASNTRYNRKAKQIEESLAEYKSILLTLQTIETKYLAWKKDPNTADRVPSDLARDIVAIREDVPYLPMIERESIMLVQLREDTKNLDTELGICQKELQDPANFDIYFKDKMQVLYCPLQYHGKINRMNRQQKANLLIDTGMISQQDNGGETAAIVLGAILGGPLGGFLGGVFNQSPGDIYNEALSHPDPNKHNTGDDRRAHFMCWETNTLSDEGLPGGGNQCWGQGSDGGGDEPDNDVNARVERLIMMCKDFYRASYTDYAKAIGVISQY